MSPEESLALLTEASYIDPTLLPAHDDDRVAAAHTWAAAIRPDLTYADARDNMLAHYQQHGTDRRLTPADINHPRRTPLPPGYYANDELAAGVGIKHTAVDPAPPSPPAEPCPTCARRYIHAADCQHAGLVTS